jgi:hypothetical protein
MKAANSIYYSGCMPIVAWALFLISALLKAGGDATIQMGLRDGGTEQRAFSSCREHGLGGISGSEPARRRVELLSNEPAWYWALR